jgi:superfamily II DNA or RNA helicase
MLADEVGLGKTIEAIAIMKHYRTINPSIKCLIVVPQTLEYQWISELKTKFDLDIEPFIYSKYIKRATKTTITVASHEDFERYYYDLFDKKWGMIIVDESHKVLKSKIYSYLLKQSSEARNVILLSATPIIRHANDYLRLLRLLDNEKYGRMTEKQFALLVEKQSFLSSEIYEIASDMELFGEDGDPNIYAERLNDINKKLKDAFLKAIIEKINENDNYGIFYVKMAISYIKNRYIIETPIIRHRRNDIPEANIRRKLEGVRLYEMEGSNVGIYEENVYELIVNSVSAIIDEKSSAKLIQIMAATFSSAYALMPLVNDYSEMFDEYARIRENVKNWGLACKRELDDLISGECQVGYTRFSKLKEIVESKPTDCKILIFSEFRQTVEAIEYLLSGLYGEKSTAKFIAGMSRMETQKAAKKFQDNEECRFLVSDKSGGEGRNFQVADCIIHFDLSWSPALMEQRIGRLDRIGRETDRDVSSIVICSENTVEYNLLSIYKDALKVFDHSMCGLEIVFEELQNMIINAFSKDLEFGLSHVMGDIENLVSEMEHEVEDEIYFSNTKNENDKTQKYIDSIISAFDQNEDTQVDEACLEWLEQVGVPYKLETRKKANIVHICYSKADENVVKMNMFGKAFTCEDEKGTFSRKYAIRHEELKYFSVTGPVVTGIMNNLSDNPRGRFAAIRNKNRENEWAGWLFGWIIKPNYNGILAGNSYSKYKGYLDQFVTTPYVYTVLKTTGEKDLNEYELREYLENNEFIDITTPEDLSICNTEFAEGQWSEYAKEIIMKSKKEAREHLELCVNIDDFKDDFEKRISDEMVSNYSTDIRKSSIKDVEKLKKALANAKFVLDSAIYVEI